MLIPRHQLFILVLTFVVYALYHASRKPLSVVKTVFHKKCAALKGKDAHWCQWKPFGMAYNDPLIQLDADDWSQLVGGLEYAYLVAYALSMFPWYDQISSTFFSGHLAERIDLRIFLAIGMAASGFTTILFGLGYYLHIHVYAFYILIQVYHS